MLRLLFQWMLTLVLTAGPVGVFAGRSNEPEPELRQHKVSIPAPSPCLSMDTTLLRTPLAVEGPAAPVAEAIAIPSDTTRPAPGSGLPNSESGWPGMVGFSLEAAAVLIFSLGLFLAPMAVGAFLGIALLLAWVGHFFALMGMKPTRRHRNFALLACAFWGVLRVLFGAYGVLGLLILAIWF